MTSVNDFAFSISFGIYEAVLSYAKAPVKVISAKGKQSVGKSFLLNHMTGSKFDIAGGRCTKGVWMSIRLYPEVTIIALDFEGFGSFERSRQEDMLMAIFGAAVSSLTVFKMAPRFDDDTKQMFNSFQDGARYLKQDDNKLKKLFSGKLALVSKDVSSADSLSVREEIKRKIAEVLRDSAETDFVSNLYGSQVRVITSETFGKKELFESFTMLKNYLHEDEETAEQKNAEALFAEASLGSLGSISVETSAKKTADKIKTVLAKIYLQDWTTFDETVSEGVLAFLKQNVEDAIIRGALLECEDKKPLGKFRDESQIVEDEATSDLLSEEDSDLELFGKTDEERSEIRKRLLKRYIDSNTEDGIGTSGWCTSLKKHFQKLITRRLSRVQEWLCLNTSEFQDKSEVKCFLADTKANFFLPLRQLWTFCQQKCTLCDRLCLNESNHSDCTEHHCYTNHKCEHPCLHCTASKNSCSYRGGHSGKHQCKEGHTCKEQCGLSDYRQCLKRCSRKIDHDSTETEETRKLHRCDADIHFCDEKCSLPNCTNKCKQSYDHKLKDKGEHRHKCGIEYCQNVCTMVSCINRCAKSHFHSLEGDAVHFCDSAHNCQEDCQFDGYCSIVSIVEGDVVSDEKYSKIPVSPYAKQVPKRLKCAIPIPPGKTKHEERPHCHYIPLDGLDQPHFCTTPCPTCNNICQKRYNHEGLHSIEHSNMVNQVFVIRKSKNANLEGKTYVDGDSADAVMCDQFCKQRGRGHTHLMTFPKHPPDFDNPNVNRRVCKGPNGETLVEVTHEYYWDHYKIQDNCSYEERKRFRQCNSVCETLESESDLEIDLDFTKDNEAFCQLDLWHSKEKFGPSGKKGHISTDGHFFGCKHTLSGYHVVLLIDASKSMGRKDHTPKANKELKESHNNRFGAVLETCDKFCADRSLKGTDFLTLITFNTTASVRIDRDVLSAGICNKLKKVEPEGDTKVEPEGNKKEVPEGDKNVEPEGDAAFAPALEQARIAIEKFANENARKKLFVPVVILLSDGFCEDRGLAISEAKKLKSFQGSIRSPEVFCILFGKGIIINTIQALGRWVLLRGTVYDILRSISTDNKVHETENALQLNDVLHEFSSKMMQKKIGVIKNEV